MTKADKPKRSSSGNPYVPKGDGDAPVQAYIAAMPGWQKAIGQKFDALVERVFPGVRKQVRWNTPFYGKDDGWLFALYCYKNYVQVTFLTGTSLDPMPPKASKVAGTRYWDIYEDEGLDEQQLAEWVRQAMKQKGQLL